MPMPYKGFVIEPYAAIQMVYDEARTAGTKRPKTRKAPGYLVRYPNSDATKFFRTIAAAKKYIDNY